LLRLLLADLGVGGEGKRVDEEEVDDGEDDEDDEDDDDGDAANGAEDMVGLMRVCESIKMIFDTIYD
jgi:hypothetical protein